MPDYRIGAYNIRERNVAILKQFSDDVYKLVSLNSCRIAGYEDSSLSALKKAERCTANDTKLCNNLSRARSTVYELALCNQWDFFVTLTLDASKVDRDNLHATYRKIAKWLNNYNSRYCCKIRYLLIPEPHKNGAWHFHGLLSGVPPNHLVLFTQHDHIPKRIKDMLQEGRSIYNWPAYAAAFGFVTVETVRDARRCSAYMTKYITKELMDSSIELNHHVYYCSQSLKRAETIYRGELKQTLENPDFENDYVRTKWFSSAEDALPYLTDTEVYYG